MLLNVTQGDARKNREEFIFRPRKIETILGTKSLYWSVIGILETQISQK